MANQTAARDPKWREDKVAELKATVGGQYFAGGAVVILAATGLLSRAVTTASAITAGVVLETKNLTNAEAGTRVRVQRGGTFEFGYTPANATDANVGDLVQWTDDQTVDTFSTGIKAGRIVEVVSASKVRVELVNTAV